MLFVLVTLLGNLSGMRLNCYKERHDFSVPMTMDSNKEFLIIALRRSNDNEYSPSSIVLKGCKNKGKIRKFESPSDLVICLEICPRNKYLAAGLNNGTVELYKIKNGKKIKSFKHSWQFVDSVKFSQRGKFLTCQSFKTVSLIDYDEENSVINIEPEDTSSAIFCCASFAPKAGYIAIGTIEFEGQNKYLIRLFNKSKKTFDESLEGHISEVLCLEFNYNDEILASGSKDGRILLWDVNTREIVCIFEKHSGPINCLCFDRKGRYLHSGSKDKTSREWDTEYGTEEPKSLREHKKEVVMIKQGKNTNFLFKCT